MFLKWNYDSWKVSYNEVEGFFLALHWLLVFNSNWYCFIISELLAGFFCASILIGNHENERKFENKIDLEFFEHQIAATRNYEFHSTFWLTIMGGMQY